MIKYFQIYSLRLFTIVSLWVVLCTFGYAQVENPENGSLNVVVMANGQPMPSARVMLMSWSDNNYKGLGDSDASGALTFTQVPAGTIDVAVLNSEGDVLAKMSGEVIANTLVELTIEVQ